ncbi:hypothetical protein SDJN02_11487, partial [Cucurbita argyrosperma subsp. argyrosperma]
MGSNSAMKMAMGAKERRQKQQIWKQRDHPHSSIPKSDKNHRILKFHRTHQRKRGLTLHSVPKIIDPPPGSSKQRRGVDTVQAARIYWLLRSSSLSFITWFCS